MAPYKIKKECCLLNSCLVDDRRMLPFMIVKLCNSDWILNPWLLIEIPHLISGLKEAQVLLSLGEKEFGKRQTDK